MGVGGNGPRGGNGIDDGLVLLELPSSHPCSGCGACCSYVATEIDKPTTARDYDQIYWYLAHRNVSVYIDWDGDWYLEFETRCEHLTENRTCGVYEDRPQVCSDFSFEECEPTTKEPAHRVQFTRPEEFFTWLQEKRPRSWKRYVAFRRAMIQKRNGKTEQPAARPDESQSVTSI